MLKFKFTLHIFFTVVLGLTTNTAYLQQVKFDRFDLEFFEIERISKMDIDGINFHSSINSIETDEVDSLLVKLNFSNLSKNTFQFVENYFVKTRFNLNKFENHDTDRINTFSSNSSINEYIFNIRYNDRYIYNNNSIFFFHESKDFKFSINPILVTRFGKQNNNSNLIFQNSRGIDLVASIENKIHIRSVLLENQQSFLNYEQKRISESQTLLGQGGIKPFQSLVYENLKGYDFFFAKSYVNFKLFKPVSFEFGHGNFFIGNGIRSLLLSNISHNYFHISLETKFKRIHYKNIYAELAALPENYSYPGRRIPTKYFAAHILSYRLSNRIEISFFEATMFGKKSKIDVSVFNPIIFSNSLQYGLNNSNNVLIGLNANYKINKKLFFYGQLMVDDISSQKNNFNNKVGYQAGMCLMDLCKVKNLDFQYEFNTVSPYSYSSTNVLDINNENTSSFTHLRQPLMHVLGANFKENIMIVSYSLNRFSLKLKSIYTLLGKNDGINNFGNDILESRKPKIEINNYTTQGILNTISAFGIEFSFRVNNNMYFDFDYYLRSEKSEISNENQNYYNLGFRSNFNRLNYDY